MNLSWDKDFINKIICGDCLEVMKEMPENSVDLIVTSPPYPGNNKMWGDLYAAENFVEAHKYLNKVWKESLRILRPGCKLIINIANTKRRPYLSNVYKLYEGINAEPLGEIIWNKGYGQCGTAWGSYCNPSDPSLADQHEYIVVFRKYGNKKKESGYKISAHNFKSWRNSIWNIPPAKAKKENHIAPFPIQIPKRLVILYSYEKEIILDPFCGIGTTCRAAKELNRNYIGIDISPDYCKLAERRLANVIPDMFLTK